MGIGPSTKETTLHHFQDPIVAVLGEDTDIDFQGILVVGTPQDNYLKYLVGKRTAVWLQRMQTDGVILSTDGWGNSDIDFANTLAQIVQNDISIVGLKFIGTQAGFVVENEYTKMVLDINKSESGIETQVVGENAVDKMDAKKALAFIKLKMRQSKS
ncbi:proline reductase [Listeria sp. FSL L7-0091]|uniref:glycine/sarcosine/betaine reductase component B subunit n=1 Tax=Listeria farberi TaxID=2713500 RepID=UPI00162972BB|nr:glycine/sarcosine/betaine reductase component B subunit [Listeria farberi]MBC2262524.1 proline reductase [Listeria farberi]